MLRIVCFGAKVSPFIINKAFNISFRFNFMLREWELFATNILISLSVCRHHLLSHQKHLFIRKHQKYIVLAPRWRHIQVYIYLSCKLVRSHPQTIEWLPNTSPILSCRSWSGLCKPPTGRLDLFFLDGSKRSCGSINRFLDASWWSSGL